MRVLFLIPFIALTLSSSAQFKLYEQGIDAYQAKNYPKAIELLNEYLDKSVRDKAYDVEVRYYVALAYFKTQYFTSSVREFDKALQLGHKNSGNIHWFMAKAYSELKAYNESISEYSKALELLKEAPNQSKLLYERAVQYEKLANTTAAIDDVKRAIAFDKNNESAVKMLDRLNQLSPKEDKIVLAKNREVVSKPTKAEKIESENVIASKPAVITKQEEAPAVTTKIEEPLKKPSSGQQPITASISTPPPIVATTNSVAPLSLAEEFKGEKRYALVIGNSKYKTVPALKNATNDANDMAEELKLSNFEVIKVIDGDYNAMREAFRKFNELLNSGPKDQTVGLFYYAGHGLQDQGENYLVPVDANVESDLDIPRTCLPMQRVVLANMERSSTRMNIVIMDACRNNPFPSSSRSAGGTGLAEIKRAKGSFIAYATAPGSTASDGDGKNGLYTQELLKAMKKPGKTIESVFKEVRYNVLKLSNDKQNTWDSSNIIGDFYFKF